MKRFGLALLLMTGMGAAAVFGYIAGIPAPDWVPTPLSAIVADLLPVGGRSAVTESIELNEYEFQLAQNELKRGDGAEIAVRLIHKPSGKTVPDAVVYATRFDMAPAGMPAMMAPLERLPDNEPGLRRFRTDVTMEGDWRLSLAAKVQGEIGTAVGRLDVKAVP